MSIKRREFLVSSAIAAASAAVTATCNAAQGLQPGPDNLPLRIGMTDWNLGKGGSTEGIVLARKIGLDGIQVSISFPKDGSPHLSYPKSQEKYRQAALDNGIQICSLCIGNLGPGEPFKSEPMGVLRVADAIEVARNIGTNDILLPFFDKSVLDFSNEKEVARTINSLKELAPRAEEKGVVISIESTLSAEELLRLLEKVASPAVQVYLDPWNCFHCKYDLMRDIPLLKDYIHQVHLKNGNRLMSDPSPKGFSWPAVAELLYKIGYKGWYVLETDSPNDLVADTKANIEYARNTFRSA